MILQIEKEQVWLLLLASIIFISVTIISLPSTENKSKFVRLTRREVLEQKIMYDQVVREFENGDVLIRKGDM